MENPRPTIGKWEPIYESQSAFDAAFEKHIKGKEE
jgi:hypothetical protein